MAAPRPAVVTETTLLTPVDTVRATTYERDRGRRAVVDLPGSQASTAYKSAPPLHVPPLEVPPMEVATMLLGKCASVQG